MASESEQRELRFRIGAVSKQTGVPTETLRAWERRYSVVEPTREEGRNRLYSQADIDRLTLIKQLVESGFAIGTIAHLSMGELSEKVPSSGADVVALAEGDELRLALVGEALLAEISSSDEAFKKPVALVGEYTALEDLEIAWDSSTPHVVVFECPTLHLSTAIALRDWVRKMNLSHFVVCYRFGVRQAHRLLEQGGIRVIRGMPTLGELQDVCFQVIEGGVAVLTEGMSAGRQYSRTQLVRLSNLSNSIKCECPRHLAGLLLGLDSFETYSLECENSNEDDAVLHARLHQATQKARAIMEEVLADVVSVEGLDV